MKRRNFISSVVSGAALAPMACGAVEKSEIKKLKWDEETDVVVVGYGGAGAAAAIEATDNGAKVLILEKMPFGGGNTAISGAESLSPRAVQMPKNSLMEPLILPIMKRAQNLSRFSVGRSGSKCPGC